MSSTRRPSKGNLKSKEPRKAGRPRSELDLGCCAPPTDGPDLRPVNGKDADAELALYGRALSHPARLEILRILGGQDCCACSDLTRDLGYAQSTVSQHIQILKDCGLLREAAGGPRSGYCLDERSMKRMKALTAAL